MRSDLSKEIRRRSPLDKLINIFIRDVNNNAGIIRLAIANTINQVNIGQVTLATIVFRGKTAGTATVT